MSLIEPGQLTRRWYPLEYHAGQSGYMHCETRFIVVPAGRRSGKTEVAKRRIVMRALSAHIPGPYYREYQDPRFGIGAPTYAQVRAIYWDDIKAMIPTRFLYGVPNETRMEIRLVNGARINLYGLDKAERVEGTPFDGFVLDEYGNMKEDTLEAHLMPSLSDRGGWLDLIGVPEGRNHYYDKYKDAKALYLEAAAAGVKPEWQTFHWTTEEVLPLYAGEAGQKEIERARREYDPITYAQEYLGSFEHYTGRAYYQFGDAHQQALGYAPRGLLCFCFDFNVEPAVAVVLQELPLPLKGKPVGTAVIGEVHIPRGGNVLSVCDKLIADWGNHNGRIAIYGDATGGSRGAAKILGSEWELVKRRLRAHFGVERISFRVQKSNPFERDRVNAVNSRCKSLSGDVRLMVDPRRAPKLVKDLEGVCLVKGGTGEIDKSNIKLTHISDALGYYIAQEFPIKKRYVRGLRKQNW
jgi:hypothetical protein